MKRKIVQSDLADLRSLIEAALKFHEEQEFVLFVVGDEDVHYVAGNGDQKKKTWNADLLRLLERCRTHVEGLKTR